MPMMAPPTSTLKAGELVSLTGPSNCYANGHGCALPAAVGVVNRQGQVMQMCSPHARQALRLYDLDMLVAHA